MENNKQISDVFFLSVQRLDADDLEKMATVVGAMECVISSHPGVGEGHFLKVAYDPSCMDSHIILEKLKELGVEARMVGL